MSSRRPRLRSLVSLVPAVLGLCLSTVAGCGGGAATETPPKTTAETKTEGAPASPAKPAESTEAKAPEAAPAAQPAATKEKFALPNVEFTPSEEREKVTLAGKELTAEACLLDTSAPEMRHEWFSQAIRSMAIAPDGALLVLDHEHKVRRYVVQPGEPCKLGLDSTFGRGGGVVEFPAEIDSIDVLDDGTVVGFEFSNTHFYKDQKFVTHRCTLKSIDPSGKTGWKSFSDTVETVDFAGDCTSKPWNYTGWVVPGKDKPSAQFVRSFGKDVLFAASIDGTHYVALHGRDGKKKFTLGKDSKEKKEQGETICWARDADACAGGICVVDSNCRMLSAWDAKKGAYVGAVDVNTLLGLHYSWPVDLVMAKGGVAYLAISHKEKEPENPPKDHKDMSVGMIFRVKGLN